MQKNNPELTVIITSKIVDELLVKSIESIKDLFPLLLITESRNSTNYNNLNTKATILYFPFTNNFSELKNFGLEGVGSEWVLFLDSDEMISEELLEEIPKLIKDSNVEGYWLPRKTYINKHTYLRYGLFYPDYQLRLFKNKQEYRFVGAIHEQLTIPFEKTQKINLPLLHYPRNPKYTAFSDIRNLLPYMHIQAKEIVTNNSSSNSLTAIHVFFFGIYKFFFLFLSGYIRGKGFMDGWNGFRAHMLLAASIGGAYTLAAKKLLTHTHE